MTAHDSREAYLSFSYMFYIKMSEAQEYTELRLAGVLAIYCCMFYASLTLEVEQCIAQSVCV